MGDTSAIPAIRPFLGRNIDEAVRAVQALGNLGDTESISRIRDLFQTSDYPVMVQEAAVALAKLGDEDIVNELYLLLESPDEHMRIAAAEALKDIQDSNLYPNIPAPKNLRIVD